MNTLAKSIILFLFCFTTSALWGQNKPSGIVKDFIKLLNLYEVSDSERDYTLIDQLRMDLFLNEAIPYEYFKEKSAEQVTTVAELLSNLERSTGNQYRGDEILQYQDSKEHYKLVLKIIEQDEDVLEDTLVFAIQQEKIIAIYAYLDTDKDSIDNQSDICPDDFGEIALFGCPDSDKDNIPDNLDQCPNTPPNVSVTSSGCGDEDRDGIPNFQDNCITEFGIKEVCGCPDKNFSSKLQKINALTNLHPIEPITVLQWVEDRLVSGSKKGRLSVSSVCKKKFKPQNPIRTINDEPSIILALENDNLLISAKHELILLELQEKTFSNPKVLDNRKYLNLKRLDNEIFLQEQHGWLYKTIEATNANLLEDTWLVGMNRDAVIATYDKDYSLNIYNRTVSPDALKKSFETAIDKPMYLAAYQDTSWLLMNNRGALEIANHSCLGARPTVSNDKRIVSIKQSQDHQLIALLFDDKTWAIWQKHPVAASWEKINTRKLVKERTTAIELSPDGKYFFEGTDEGILQAYIIVKK